jgi:hypothetical protein
VLIEALTWRDGEMAGVVRGGSVLRGGTAPDAAARNLATSSGVRSSSPAKALGSRPPES